MIVSLVILTLALWSNAQICCVPPQWEGTQGNFLAVSGADTADPVIVQGVQYTGSGGNCTRTPLRSFAPDCIPSDAKLVRSSYLGLPNNKLMINTYTYTRGNLEISTTVTANTCVPVGEVIQGSTSGEYVLQNVGFSGISAGISDTTIFTPLSSCKNSPLVSVNLSPIHNRLLRRYSILLPQEYFYTD